MTTVAELPQALYRFYDRDDRLLYVGITGNIGVRWRAHNALKPWWTDVVRSTIEHYATRADVLAAEQLAIETEHPLHNIVHNRAGRTELPDPVYPRGTQDWDFVLKPWGIERTMPLWLCWEIDGESITDDWLPDEIDAIDLWRKWLGQYPFEKKAIYGRGTAPIWWFVAGREFFEGAPFQDRRLVEDDEHFLTNFTWPRSAATGESLRWASLPVQEKGWRVEPDNPWINTKGGFITEVTGWTPSPLQPFVSIDQLRQMTPRA